MLVSFVLGLVIGCPEAALAQSSHPYCRQYQQYCQQFGQPYCQQYQQYCSSSSGVGFGFETFELRSFIGVGGYFSTQSGLGLSSGVILGPVISRGRDRSTNWRFRGIQLIPEVGISVLIMFTDLSHSDDYRVNLSAPVGFRVLKGFGVVSLGASGHVLLGGSQQFTNAEAWRFSIGMRTSIDVAFANGVIGLELSYCWVTDLEEESINSVMLSLYFDWIKIFRGIASLGAPRIGY